MASASRWSSLNLFSGSHQLPGTYLHVKQSSKIARLQWTEFLSVTVKDLLSKQTIQSPFQMRLVKEAQSVSLYDLTRSLAPFYCPCLHWCLCMKTRSRKLGPRADIMASSSSSTILSVSSRFNSICHAQYQYPLPFAKHHTKFQTFTRTNAGTINNTLL
jgi:hypothetical protein